MWLIDHFKIPPDSVLIYGTYEPWLVTLSLTIAVFTSFMALQVTGQAPFFNSKFRQNMAFIAAGIAQGGGVWAMHFIGMLAFKLCTNVSYDWNLTFISMLPSVAASWLALRLIDSERLHLSQLLLGGLLVGGGIGTMHYMGMAAMQMAPILRYDPLFFLLSILCAVVLAILALWIRFGLRKSNRIRLNDIQLNLVSAVVMGLAISGMHYLGMLAARFVTTEQFVADTAVATSQSLGLALGVTATTLVITCFALGLNLVMKYRDMSVTAQAGESRIRAMMDTAVDGIIAIDEVGTIMGANAAASQILGWSNTELLNKNINFVMPEPFRSEHNSYLHAYLTTGVAKMIGNDREAEALHKDGHKVPIRLAIGHAKVADENYFIGFITDITERLKIENSLKENEEKFRSLIDNIPGAAYRSLNTPMRQMIFVSETLESITGYPSTDFILPNASRSFVDLIHPDDLSLVNHSHEQQTSYTLEYRIIRGDGNYHWVLDTGHYIRDQHGNISWIDGFLMDITDRKVIENELHSAKNKAEQAAASRAEFLANMSHEIRTPMNSILGFCEVLQLTTLTTDQKSYLKSINTSAKSLLHLLNDILDSAKLDKGKMQLEYCDFNLREQLDIVISTFWMQTQAKNLNLELIVDDGLSEYYKGAPDRIRQVLNNLVGNAVKFTENGGVSVEVKPDNSKKNVIFSISDTGIGIDKERLETIFEPFTQADASMTRRFGGTGLGTTISKQLVELMGGNISATSEHGKGSCFEFNLPLAPGEYDAARVSAPTAMKLPSLRLLIADDVVQNLDLLRILLGKQGHHIVTAFDGLQVIDLFDQQTFDLIIMDIQMPKMDGHTAARKIRAIEKQKELNPTPIIALTASVLETDKIEAKNAGMEGFACKPIDISALTLEMARLLNIASDQICMLETEHNTINQLLLINLEQAKALWLDMDFFAVELNKFLKQNNQVVDELRSYLNIRDYKTLANKTHALKGVSGNLCLVSLSRCFSNLETAAINEDHDKIEVLIDTVARLLVEINNELEVLNLTVTSEPENTKKELDLPALQNNIDSLIKIAANHEIDEQRIESLIVSSGDDFNLAAVKIKDAFDEFEFQDAINLLTELDNLIQRRL